MTFTKNLGAFFILSLGLIASVHGVSVSTNLDTTVPPADPAYRADTGTQTGRLNRNGTSSSCGSQKPNPGVFSSADARQYDEYKFVALATGCVTVTLTGGDNTIFSAAYSDFFSTNIESNYLADIGASPTAGIPTKTYSFDVVEGQTFTVVVHEVNPGGGIGEFYTLDVSGVKISPDFSITETIDAVNPQQSYAYIRQTANQTGRLNRNGVGASCAEPKQNPGIGSATGLRRVDLYRITPFTSGCATVTVSHVGSGSVMVAAYDENGYNSVSPTDNYLADPGLSATNTVRQFSFLVKAGVPFDLVVHELNPSGSTGDEYTLNISGVKLAPTVEINGRLDSIDQPPTPDFSSAGGEQTGRLNRNGVGATCDDPKPNPGLLSAVGERRYDLYTFTPASSGCVEVVFRNNSNAALFSMAYNSSGLNTSDPSANYLADPGESPADSNDFEVSYSFNVNAGVPFSVIVHERNSGGGIGQNYRLTVRGRAMSATKRAAPFDLTGDMRSDVAIFRPGPAEWWFLRSSDSGDTAYQFGQTTDRIVPADYTGDGVIDVAFFRPSTGQWFILRSDDLTFYAFPFGAAGDIPAPGDFDGDGMADAAVYRPTAGTWFILRSSDGGVSISNFGIAEDHPVVGDYDGDSYADLAIYRPSLGQWWLNRSSEGLIVYQFGSFTDIPIPADFTGDGRTDVAFFRPSNEWYVLRSEDASFFSFPFGTGGDMPVPSDYDGDGVADAAVFRPSNNIWFILRSQNGFTAAAFGTAGDVPLQTAYQP